MVRGAGGSVRVVQFFQVKMGHSMLKANLIMYLFLVLPRLDLNFTRLES